MENIQVVADKWSRDLEKVPLLQQIQDATGIEKLYLVLGGFTFGLLFLLIGFGAGLICNIVGFLYPAYRSFKAVETTDKKDDIQWLTYWVVYACFSVVEVFGDVLLYWLPFYYALKLGFLLYLFMPSTQGALFLYEHFLRPWLMSQEADIDEALKHAASSTGKVLTDAGSIARDVGRDVTKVVADRLAQQDTGAASSKTQ